MGCQSVVVVALDTWDIIIKWVLSRDYQQVALRFYIANEKLTLYHSRAFSVLQGPGGKGGTSYNGLYGEAPPKRGTFFRLEVYKRVEISRAEV